LSSPGFGTESAADVALGDVDRDGDLDALAANAISKPNRLWLNRGSGGPALSHLAAPSGLSASALSGSAVHLDWVDNASEESAYLVERSPDGATGWTEIASLPAGTEAYSNTGLACGTLYFYRVRAYRASDGAYSAYSSVADASTQLCLLPAPSGLKATPMSPSQIDLAWSDNAVDESNYQVERSLDGSSGWTQIASLPAEAEAYSDTGLACGRLFFYRVRAYRASDGSYSAYSQPASASSHPCPLPAPTGLTASAVSPSAIELAWTDHAIDETGYYVERSLNDVSSWVVIAVLPENSSSYSATELACHTEYYFRVRAYKDQDEEYSPYSNLAKMMTPSCSYRIYLPLQLKK
jgi:hypothetical protein